MNFLKIAAFLALPVSAALAQPVLPGGRLTLTSNTPVMTADVTGATTVYYAPYVGGMIPVWNGTTLVHQSMLGSQLVMTLNASNHLAGNIYDLFAFMNGTTLTIGAGPAWSSSTSRGIPTDIFLEFQGDTAYWVNTNAINLTNGSTTYSTIPVARATYLGSVYMTANGQTAVQFKPSALAGGSNNVIGIWNAYHRVPIESLCTDSNTSWTTTNTSFETLDTSNSNRVTYLDGGAYGGRSFVTGRVSTIAYNATAGNGVNIGVLQNNTSGTPSVIAAYQQASTGGSAVGATTFTSEENFLPLLGLNYLQAMQRSPNGTTATIAFNGFETGLLFKGEF